MYQALPCLASPPPSVYVQRSLGVHQGVLGNRIRPSGLSEAMVLHTSPDLERAQQQLIPI